MALATTMAEKRGPRIGDAASLWNFTPAPGWNKEEVQVLRLCLMKYGVGQWQNILSTGLLPGKLIQQLNGQTQRLLGQQSLAAYTGLRVDIDRIRADNEQRTDVLRKTGLIINDGSNLTKDVKLQMKDEAIKKYGLSEEQLREVDQALEGLAAASNKVGGEGIMTKAGMAPVVDVMTSDPADLNRDMKLQLLRRLASMLGIRVDKWRVLCGLSAKWYARQQDPTGAAAAAAAAAAAQADDAEATDGDFKENVPLAGNDAKPSAAGPKPKAAGRPALGKDGAVKKRAAPKKRKSEAAAAGAELMAGELDNDDGDDRACPSGQGGDDDGDDDGYAPKQKQQGRGKQGAGRKAAATAPAAAVQGRTTGRARQPKKSFDFVSLADDGAFDAADVAQLAAMGFSPRKAKEALAESGMELEAAVEWLFRNCC